AHRRGDHRGRRSPYHAAWMVAAPDEGRRASPAHQRGDRREEPGWPPAGGRKLRAGHEGSRAGGLLAGPRPHRLGGAVELGRRCGVRGCGRSRTDVSQGDPTGEDSLAAGVREAPHVLGRPHHPAPDRRRDRAAHQAQSPESPRAAPLVIENSGLRAMYRTMVRVRLFEERVAQLVEAREIRTPCHLYIGQEAIAAGVCAALEPRDYVWGGHRSHGHYLAKGGDLRAMMAELYGKATGCSEGRGGSMHLVA